MPYRVDIPGGDAAALMRLLDLGALDIDVDETGRGAALMPDAVTADAVARVLAVPSVHVSPAVGRDAESVWRLARVPVRVGRIRIVPDDAASRADLRPGDVRLLDSAAFGTGVHATTALCLECLGDLIAAEPVETMLDVGTGTGVLALAGLALGVAAATAIDIDAVAARAARENARVNRVAGRLHVALCDLEAVQGRWPLVMANILAAPLIDMAPALAAHLGHAGRLVLSGIPSTLTAEVERAYRHRGLHRVEVRHRGGWAALVWRASW